MPLSFAERAPGDWTGGFGDLALAFKQVIAHSGRRGSILSVAGELSSDRQHGAEHRKRHGGGRAVRRLRPAPARPRVPPAAGGRRHPVGPRPRRRGVLAGSGRASIHETGIRASSRRWWRSSGARDWYRASARNGIWRRNCTSREHASAHQHERGRPDSSQRTRGPLDAVPELLPVGMVRRGAVERLVAPNEAMVQAVHSPGALSRPVRYRLLAIHARNAQTPTGTALHDPAGTLFQSADECMACHNGLITPAGEDVSIGTPWRASMMAHSARDPYWQRECAARSSTIRTRRRRSRTSAPGATCRWRTCRRRRPARTGTCSPTCPAPGTHARSARGRRRVVHALPSDHERHSARRRASPAASSSTRRRRSASRRVFGPYEVDRGRTRAHALGDRVSSRRRRRTFSSPRCARPATPSTRMR